MVLVGVGGALGLDLEFLRLAINAWAMSVRIHIIRAGGRRRLTLVLVDRVDDGDEVAIGGLDSRGADAVSATNKRATHRVMRVE